MEVHLLGPVEVWAAGEAVDVGGPRQRCVLAALAVDAGRPVPVDTVVDRVWGVGGTDRARPALYTYVARIRRVLDQAAARDATRVRLVRRAGGYALDLPTERVDMHRFRQLLAQARRPGCADEQRAELLRRAIGLWRGEPLAGLDSAWAEWTRQAWRAEQVEAVVAWADAELRLGNAATVITPLCELIRLSPLVESLTAVLMRALAVAGRPADALDEYTRIRKQLVHELGTDPGGELQALHQAILRGEVAAVEQRPIATSPIPAQLPADVQGFAGRTEQLARLDTLADLAAARAPTAVVIAAVSGSAGVGKTAMAVHWAHRVRHTFPDGQLYVNLRGYGPAGTPMHPAEAVRGFLDALGTPPRRIPSDLDAQSSLYRSQLAGKRMLVVLDNTQDADQVRPLLPGAPGCMVVVTSRNQLTGLVAQGAYPIALDLPSHDEARHLLARRLGQARVTAESLAADEIVSLCARLPLALAVAAARAATSPGLSLTALTAQMRQARDVFGILNGGDSATDINAVFSWSYRSLSSATGRLFRLLGLHPGPDISAPAAASLAGIPADEVPVLLAELTRTSMLTEHVSGRYTCHDLLRAYAASLARGAEPPDQRQAATHRILDHYLHSAYDAAMLLNPIREPITLGQIRPGVTTEHPTDHGQALSWLTSEHSVLLAAVEHAASAGMDTHAWQMAWALADFLDRRGHWHDQVFVMRAAVDAAGRLPDVWAQALTHRLLAGAYAQQGHGHDARTHLEHVLDLRRRSGDKAGQAHAHLTLAQVWEQQNDHARALDHARRALDLFQTIDHQAGRARALNSVGWFHALLGEFPRALTACQRSLILMRETGDGWGQAAAWDSLGYIYHRIDQHAEAVTCYQSALDLFCQLGDRQGEAGILIRLGDSYHRAGDHAAAGTAWIRALTILDELESPEAIQLRTKLHHAGDTSTSKAGSPTPTAP